MTVVNRSKAQSDERDIALAEGVIADQGRNSGQLALQLAKALLRAHGRVGAAYDSVPPVAPSTSQICKCSHHMSQHKEGVTYQTSYGPGFMDCKGMHGSATPGFVPCDCRKFEPWDGPWDAKTGRAANVPLMNLSTTPKGNYPQ